MLKTKLLLTAILTILASFSSVYADAPPASFQCAFGDTDNIAKCPYVRPPTDTIRVLAIYCTGRVARSACQTGYIVNQSGSKRG